MNPTQEYRTNIVEGQKYDIIIPVGPDDIKFVSKVVEYLIRHFEDINYIYLITNFKFVSKLSKKNKKYSKCKVLDEDTILPTLKFKDIQKQIVNRGGYKYRCGWYFQQFIKYAFAQSVYAGDYYLSWDADTLPLTKISFFDGGNILFNPKKEYHKPYFKSINKMLGFGKVYGMSFISEHMLFSRKIVCEMIHDIESAEGSCGNWIETIIDSCDFKEHTTDFSEFETYGSYCHIKYPELYKPRHLNSFREAGFIAGRNIDDSRLKEMSFDIDTVSFEMRHFPKFPYNIPNYIWMVKKKLKELLS